jgi:hypothetical protein
MTHVHVSCRITKPSSPSAPLSTPRAPPSITHHHTHVPKRTSASRALNLSRYDWEEPRKVTEGRLQVQSSTSSVSCTCAGSTPSAMHRANLSNDL